MTNSDQVLLVVAVRQRLHHLAKPLADVLAGLQTHHAVHHLPIADHHQGGHGSHVVVKGQLAMLVDVHAGQLDPAALLGHDVLQARGQGLAGTAPAGGRGNPSARSLEYRKWDSPGMKIHHNRTIAVDHPLLKVFAGLHVEDGTPSGAGQSSFRLQQVHKAVRLEHLLQIRHVQMQMGFFVQFIFRNFNPIKKCTLKFCSEIRLRLGRDLFSNEEQM